MLIPNNLNIYGRLKRATSLKGYKLRLEFPDETVIAYLKQPLSNTVEGKRRILTYDLEDLINYDDYWWLPTEADTEFSLPLNLLPPFPQLNPVDLAISCRPDIAVGVEAEVNTTIRIKAEQNIDNMFLTMGIPPFFSPGVSMAITGYSEDSITDPRQFVTSPTRKFPFPRLSLRRGDTREYQVKTKINADLTGMTSLKCQQDLVKTRLLLLSDSSATEPPFNITVLDDEGQSLPVERTISSTILQALAQVMYSPFSIRRETPKQQRESMLEVPVQ